MSTWNARAVDARDAVRSADADRAAARLSRWSAAFPAVAAYAPRPAPPPSVSPRDSTGSVLLVLFAVLLPAGVVCFELLTRFCGSSLFDPIPTYYHAALALLVPAANGVVWWLTGDDRPRSRRALWAAGLLNGAAVGAGLYFTVLFLPLLPVAAIAVVFVGVGLLPMAPLFSFAGALACRRRLRQWSGVAGRPGVEGRLPGARIGFVAALACLLGMQAPVIVTQHLMYAASNGEGPASRAAAVDALRTWGSRDAMLRACYASRSGSEQPFAFFATGGRRVWPHEAQVAFYRVTGVPFENVRPPARVASRAAWAGWDDEGREWAFDASRGGDVVGTRQPGLSLASSRMEAAVDADAATSYNEWTLVFRNDQPFEQEARARVLLPPGGVVSRLTLWINGEPREAAFGGRAAVKAAYREVVVVQRRDPVLVTTAGPDRVQVQCFPVPAKGQMKVRLGVTAPLALPDRDRGELRLPSFVERNFSVAGGDGKPKPGAPSIAHDVWVESTTAAVDAPAFARRPSSKPGTHLLVAGLTERQLADRPAVAFPRDASVATVWANDPFDPDGGVVVQTVGDATAAAPSRVVLAVDASAPMAGAVARIADVLAALPAGVELTAVVAADEVVELTGDAGSVAAKLRAVPCRGGQDAVPALRHAFYLARARGPGANDAVVLWAHGPQPMALDEVEPLVKQLQGTGRAPRLLELQAVAGPNVVLDALAEVTRVEAVPLTGDAGHAVRSLFASWSGSTPKPALARARAPAPPDGERVRQADLNLARLWAHDEVLRRIDADPAAADALQLAVGHQLVTPVSGAVVLETQAQYDAHGLKPVSAVPLPPAVLMALLVAPLVWWTRRRWLRQA